MKLIVMMIALLIIGLLVIKQMAPNAEAPAESVDVNSPDSGLETPRVPARPDEVKQFGKQMSDYLQSEAAKRAATMDAAQK